MLSEQTKTTRLLFVCCCSIALTQAYIADRNQEFNFKATPQDKLWPLPRYHWTIENQVMTLDPKTFRLISWPPEAAIDCDIIQEAMDRYSALLASNRRGILSRKFQELSFLNITVSRYKGRDHCGYPKIKDDESYNLHIYQDPPEATLSSHTVWGMLRGLETFSQMVYQDVQTKAYLINVTKIQDWPKFSHRGILLDTARHFIPTRVLKKNLDAMAYNKMNVFHWHIVDDQSFPFESKVYPNLTILGAYSINHIYRQDDIKEIIRYARLRGIRVIPEFDTPGHTRSIGKAFPDLVTKCYYNLKVPGTSSDSMPVSSDGLDPSRERTYQLVRTIIQEFKQVFADDYIHLGMDETNVECWMSNARVQKFMMSRGIPNEQYLEEYYAKRIINITHSLGYKYVIWEDPLENGVQVSPETVVQLWKPSWISRARLVAGKKHHMILSSCWYINMIRYGEQWTTFYECNPLQFTLNKTDRELMLGGEACLWAEYIDATNLLQTLWPSAAAVAERLWNGEENLEADDETRRRFDQNRCRLLRRGIQAQPVYSGFCYEDILENDYEDYTIEMPFRTKPDILFIWVPVFVSIFGCLYWLMLSRTVLRSFLFKWCVLKRQNACNRSSAEPRKVRT